MRNHKEILKARMAGAKAALEGKHIDANTYPEDDDLHWEWLQGWADARLKWLKSRKHNAKPTDR